MKKTVNLKNLEQVDVELLIHGLYSFTKNSRSVELLEKLHELECLFNVESDENTK